MKKTWRDYFSHLGMLAILTLGVLIAPIMAQASQAAPFAATKAPTYITEKSAKLNGAVNPNEMPDTYQWYEWGVVGRYDVVYETRHTQIWSATQMLDTSADLSGLAPSEQYFYRQIAENSRGKDVGQTTYFTTKALPNPIDPIIIVQTNAPDSINDTSAVLKGYISPHGNTSAKYWFQWGATSRLENETNHNNWGTDSGPVQVSITGLTPGTNYYYRMVGGNTQGVVYGVTKVFITTGTPPPPPEPLRDQNISQPQAQGDGVSRKITTNAQAASQDSFLSGANTPRPGDLFGLGNLFNKKQTTNTTSATKTSTSTQVNNTNQLAASGAATPLGTFWSALTGKKSVEVTIQKIGPDKVPSHTAVEYRIAYAYRLNTQATNAKLKIILPANVVYIGDNTVNELLLEEGAGPERTYDLPIGRLENGSTRTISILGMTTGDANGTFPDARVHMEYVDARGALQVVGTGATTQPGKEVATVSSSSFSILPSSFFGWLLYVLIIVGSIIGIRKAKAYYNERKEEIEAEKAALGNDERRSLPTGQPA